MLPLPPPFPRPEYRKAQHIAPKSLERKERNRILREVERSQNHRNIAMIYLLFYTGLRVSELVALNRKDLIMGERSGMVLVRKGKGDVARKVPLPIEARNYLIEYLQTREDDDEAIFLSNYQKRPHFSLQGSHLNICYFHQDLH